MAVVVAALAFAPAPAPFLTDLFTELDARLPNGQYRIPSLVSTPRGTLLAIINGREHRRDVTPNIIHLRRSVDDGATWSDAVPLLRRSSRRDEPVSAIWKGSPDIARGAQFVRGASAIDGTRGREVWRLDG